jgi:uncharacterized protein YecE (DUF72 family)
MKANGSAEIRAALSRVRRLRALGRIGREDSRYIEDRLEEVQARIATMIETDADGDPVAA